jgi:hypothetical protein
MKYIREHNDEQGMYANEAVNDIPDSNSFLKEENAL